MKDFLLTYWKEIAEGGVIVLTLLLILLKNPGKSNPALQELFYELPSIINKVESIYGAGHGAAKKDAVINACDDLFIKLTGFSLKKSQYFLNVVDKQIEKILSTPSRKEN